MRDAFTLMNPHLSLRMTWEPAEVVLHDDAIDPTWSKWSPRNGEEAHWYTPERLRDLITAYLRKDRESGGEMTVRDFVEAFRGHKSTVKRSDILNAIGA